MGPWPALESHCCFVSPDPCRKQVQVSGPRTTSIPGQPGPEPNLTWTLSDTGPRPECALYLYLGPPGGRMWLSQCKLFLLLESSLCLTGLVQGGQVWRAAGSQGEGCCW